MAALLLAVLVFAPYQFAYLVLVLVHLFTTVRFLILAWDDAAAISPPSPPFRASTSTGPRSTATTAAPARRLWARYHSSFSVLFILVALLPINALILVVWVRNLAVGWLAPFSSDHNILLLVGFLANVEALHGGRVVHSSGARKNGLFVFVLLPLPRCRCSLNLLCRPSLLSLTTTLLLSSPVLYSLLYGIRSAHLLYPLTNIVMLFLAVRTSPSLSFSAPTSGTAVPGRSIGDAAPPGGGKRRTSEPPEPVADLLAASSEGGKGRKASGVRE
jgi:glycosylphosphatidylinositol deacylase